MKITLLSDDAIRLDAAESALTIEAQSAEQSYSPFHMLASALAVCTYSVLHSWASHAELDASGLSLEVHWSFAEKPHRVGDMKLTMTWPGLPPERLPIAQRVAALCAIHNTLQHPPTITMERSA